MDTIIIIVTTIITGVIIFHKLKKIIMGAQAVTQETMNQILALVQEAFNTNVGDLTEAEATAQRAEFETRLEAIIHPPPTP